MAHTWSFFRVGGFDQVRIETGADIAHLAELDPKLWVAIACPAADIELDPHTLALLDGDRDGRIRVPDVIAAAKWLCSVLLEPDELLETRAELPIESVDGEGAEGKQLRASMRRILKNLGKGEATAISPADVLDTAAIFANTLFNGDGIVPPESAGEDEATAQAIRDAMLCLGAERDASGKDGLSKAKAEVFFAELEAFASWWQSGIADAAIAPLGDATREAFAAYAAVRDKVRDYFTRCALAAMDERAAGALGPSEAELAALAKETLSASSVALAALPLARIAPSGDLPLRAGLNPAFAAAIAELRRACVEPLIGPREALARADWEAIEEKLAPHGEWLAKKPQGSLGSLGTPRILELAGSDAKAKVDALITEDLAVEGEAKAIAAVDRLVHYYRDFATLLRSFVSFEDFYGRRAKATFQAGELFLDGRSFDLCMRVSNAAKHAALAAQSMTYLAYCDCTRGAKTMTIVAAITNGDADFLVVGRNGVFYDRKGDDWDATITKIIEQPISVRQAFWAPYKKVARFVSAQMERFAGERASGSDRMLEEGVEAIPTSGTAETPPAAPAFDIAKFAGVFAAIGLALGAIGTAVAAVVTGFMGLELWQMPLAVTGALLVISGPSMLLAALKLRQRNLGPLLDAGGWAINTRARVNVAFGAALTKLAALPRGSSRTLTDPYADKRRPWRSILVAVLLLAGGVYAFRQEITAWLAPRVEHVPLLREWIVAEPEREAAEDPSSSERE